MLQNEWNEFKTKKKFFGNKLDLDSGYIHLNKSTIKENN